MQDPRLQIGAKVLIDRYLSLSIFINAIGFAGGIDGGSRQSGMVS